MLVWFWQLYGSHCVKEMEVNCSLQTTTVSRALVSTGCTRWLQVAAVPVTAYESGPNQQTHINPTRLKSPCLDFLICNFFGLFCSSMDLQHCYFVLLFLHECISQCKCISEPCLDGGGLVWVRTKPLGPEYVIPALHFPNTRFPSNQRAGGGGGGAEG